MVEYGKLASKLILVVYSCLYGMVVKVNLVNLVDRMNCCIDSDDSNDRSSIKVAKILLFEILPGNEITCELKQVKLNPKHIQLRKSDANSISPHIVPSSLLLHKINTMLAQNNLNTHSSDNTVSSW